MAVKEAPVAVDSMSVPERSDDGATSASVARVKARPEREAVFKDYLRVFGYATKLDFLAYGFAAFASIGTGITLPLLNIVTGRFAKSFTSFGTTSVASFQSQLDSLALDLFILFIVRFILTSIKQFCFRMIGLRLSAAIRRDYLESIFAQSIHVLDSMPPGTAASTITSSANLLQLGVSEKLGTLFEWSSTMIAAIIIAFIWSWELTLVTLSIVIFLIAVISAVMPFILKQVKLMNKADSKASAIASEALGSIRIIMACGAEDRTVQRFEPHVKQAAVHGRNLGPLIGFQLALVFFGLYAVFGLVEWYGVHAYLQGRVSGIAPVIIAMMSVMLVIISIERITQPVLAIGKATVAACEFFTVIDSPRPRVGTFRDPDVSAAEDIVFKDVTFAYPSRPHVKVLDHLDLTIEAGKITAIVGPSGSGKSTIVGLIERWYNLEEQSVIAKAIQKKTKKKSKKGGASVVEDDEDDDTKENMTDPVPSGPAITLEGSVETGAGCKLDNIDMNWWRSQIGFVQQEPFLFNETIFRNVAYGLTGSPWEHEPDDKKRELVKDACREAFADEFIDLLPDGYDTMVGESGMKLSGGQRQRIAIARSIVKRPKILILDEATSSIDVRGERIVQAALDKVSKNRTTITIAHRLSTIRKADRIVVLQKGVIVEHGTHESLIARESGLYHGLVKAQQLSLGDEVEGGDDLLDPDARDLAPEKSLVKSRRSGMVGTDAVKVHKENMNGARGFIRSFVALLLEQKSQLPYNALTLFFAACVATSVPVMAYLFGQLINVFTLPVDELPSQSRFWALMWLTLAIGIGVSTLGMIFFATLAAAFIQATYKLQYFGAMLYQKTSFFDSEENSCGALTARVADDPKRLDELLGWNMAMAFQAFFGIIGAIILSFYFGWKLSLVALAVTLPINIFASYYRLRYEIDFDKMNSAVFQESSTFASESIGASRTVASLTLEGTINARYDRLLRGHILEAFKKARVRTPIFAISDSITLACQALLFWYGGRLILVGEISGFNFFVCFTAAMRAAENAGQGLGLAPNAAQVTSASNRIMDLRESRNQESVSETETIPESEKGMKIEFQDVHFNYPTRDVDVIKGFNITVERGQFAALVGASGCGKTTIVSLMERFYEPNKGKILCNGKDISKINIYTWRRYLSLVAQEPSLLQGTIRENVLLGVEPTEDIEERMRQACRDASIDEFILSLPEGYNTNIGSRGVSLSGGQKQRISIARALIRDPKILLLDEATSSLDSESERLVQAALERAGKGRTVLVVAHRLATVQRADVIFVVGGGRVLEQGNHAELLRRRGVYWNMCQNQALDM